MSASTSVRKVWESELEERVGEVLCYIWDPIGVSSDGTPETRDEYDDYIGAVCDALMRGESKNQIVNLLGQFETERIGMDEADRENGVKVAEVLLDWKRYLAEQGRL